MVMKPENAQGVVDSNGHYLVQDSSCLVTHL